MRVVNSDKERGAIDLILPRIREMAPYTPGSQPEGADTVKLNTNENPFPVSDPVIKRLRAEIEENRFHKYPPPASDALRNAIAEKYNRPGECVIAGNGSDEILSLVFRALLEPGRRTVYPDPSYSLYPVLAAMTGATAVEVPLDENWSVDFNSMLTEATAPNTPLVVITHPNAPTGIAEKKSELLDFARRNPGFTLVDEAYVEFGGESLAPEAGRDDWPRLMVVSTFSKAYSLAGMRVGWLVAHPDFIVELDKIRDSYNLSRLAQTAALAALEDEQTVRERIAVVMENREKLAAELRGLGFSVLPSSANFLFAEPPAPVSKSGVGDRYFAAPEIEETQTPARAFFNFLKNEKIFVRYFDRERLDRFVRITVGTDDQNGRLIAATRRFLNNQ